MEASRMVIGGPSDLNVNLEREGFLVQFKLSPRATILSKHLLKPTYSDIQQTKKLEVPDITPFNTVVNFEEQNIYEPDDYSG